MPGSMPLRPRRQMAEPRDLNSNPAFGPVVVTKADGTIEERPAYTEEQMLAVAYWDRWSPEKREHFQAKHNGWRPPGARER